MIIPNSNFRDIIEPWRFLIKSSFLLILLSSSSVNALVSDSKQSRSLEWQVLTKTNFTSQISLHRYVLLLVTVPWSGECRSLMKEVADAAAYKLDTLDDLRLMVLYKDKEKMLADALGVTRETTIFIFYRAVSYKYQGRLRAQNILSSYSYLISSQPEELPLKLLNTPEDVNAFFESTDKAVLLFEFCGWTGRLLGQGKNNGSENGYPVNDASDSGITLGTSLLEETSLDLTFSRDKKQKGLNNEKLTCDTDKGTGEIPWVMGFSSENHSASSETENTSPGVGLSCTFDEFEQFKSFFEKFMTSAREFFLPPERQRYGLISERYLLSSLGVRDSDSWLVMVHFAGCSNCSKILKEGHDLRTEFSMQELLVTELEGEGHDFESTLPGNTPSVILFVDRSSESLDTRSKSKVALETFRKLALHNQLFYQFSVKDSLTRRKISHNSFGGTKDESTSDPTKHSRKDSLQLARVDNIKNKMSVMIINEDGNIASDAEVEGSSIQDILAHLLRQKKETKLSFVAKEVGFQLLSGDFEVKLAELLQPQAQTSKSDNVFSETSNRNDVESSLNLGKESMLNDASSRPVHSEDQTVVAATSKSKEQRITYILKNTQLTSSSPDQMVAGNTLGAAQDLVEGRSSTQVDKLDVQQPPHGDSIRFYFCDGGFHLLNSLTSGSEVPSMIIIDPIREQHFIYPPKEEFSYSSLHNFIGAFLNLSLIPHQRSESVTISPRKATRPPFINLDFREVDSIPRVSVRTFSELVLGFNESEHHHSGDSWEKDVMVLFTNTWCGVSQRMQLVVREVFRAFSGYLNTVKSEHSTRESALDIDFTENAKSTKFPLIFLMDCTFNDCSALLKSMGQKEVYPALLLFPAQRKTAVSYQGDMSVNSVIKFLVDHGSNSFHLNQDNGIIWTARQKGGKNVVEVEDASLALIQNEEISVADVKWHEAELNNRIPTGSVKFPTSNGLQEATSNVVVGSVLIATDRLLNAPPFDKSMVLIVQTNQGAGFQGLIINKHISWESFEGMNKGFEFVKQAPISFGGPLMVNGMPLVSLTRRVIHEGYSEVFPSIYFLDQSATVKEIESFQSRNLSTDDYWFFLGFSSWGWDQLFAEIAEGAWQLSDDSVAELNWPGS